MECGGHYGWLRCEGVVLHGFAIRDQRLESSRRRKIENLRHPRVNPLNQGEVTQTKSSKPHHQGDVDSGPNFSSPDQKVQSHDNRDKTGKPTQTERGDDEIIFRVDTDGKAIKIQEAQDS
jgi:hypothetical protein